MDEWLVIPIMFKVIHAISDKNTCYQLLEGGTDKFFTNWSSMPIIIMSHVINYVKWLKKAWKKASLKELREY